MVGSRHVVLPASHLEGFVQPEDGAGSDTTHAVKIPGDKVGVIKPAAKHVIWFIPHSRQKVKSIYQEKEKEREKERRKGEGKRKKRK